MIGNPNSEINVVCCVGSVGIQIEMLKYKSKNVDVLPIWKATLTNIPHEHVPKSHVIIRVITCDFGTCSRGIFVREVLTFLAWSWLDGILAVEDHDVIVCLN